MVILFTIAVTSITPLRDTLPIFAPGHVLIGPPFFTLPRRPQPRQSHPGREGQGARGTVSELDTTAGFVKQSNDDPMARMARVVAVGVPHPSPNGATIARMSSSR